MNPYPLHTRRAFLRSTLLGGSLSWAVPSFVQNTIGALHAQSEDSLVQSLTGKDGPILVVLQLAGGNDGLNTIIPHANDFYYQARRILAVPKGTGLRLDDELAFHPVLNQMKELYDSGHFALMNGVGYPNPNRSHFRSTEIWQTAADANRFEKHGWIGRYFDSQCKGADPTVGVAFGNSSPQAFTAATPTGVCLGNPQAYRYQPMNASDPNEEYFHRQMNRPGGMETGEEVTLDGGSASNSGGSIGEISGSSNGAAGGISSVDFLEKTALDAQVSSDRIAEIIKKSPPTGTYPNSRLAQQFKLVSQLISGGLSSRVYYVSQGGFDTHTNQAGNHERLLREMSEAVGAFVKDLKTQGNFDRVMVMTFSEFGRRVSENASGGTDHGAAAPMFLIGGAVKGGRYGTHPSLDPKDLVDGDLAFNIDFRSVYASVLEDWLRCPTQKVLGRKFQKVDCIG